MLNAYRVDGACLQPAQLGGPESELDKALWIDLLQPDSGEMRLTEDLCGFRLPTRNEMRALEISSRLYSDGDAIFMTASLISSCGENVASVQPVTFILTQGRLVTIRHMDAPFFQAFLNRTQRLRPEFTTAIGLAIGLLETCLDQISDVLERISEDVDRISHTVFRDTADAPLGRLSLQTVIYGIGRAGDLNSRMSECLVSFSRLNAFLGQLVSNYDEAAALGAFIKTTDRDVTSLSDHALFLSNKITFLLDATLGLINIEQNSVIKIVSIASVVFLPPTLVASIYGMNFAGIPELGWSFGYPAALLAMIASSIIPYLVFKRKGWL